MPQLNFLNGYSKLVKTIVYLFLAALITGYAGANGWVFSQVMNRPTILENYQKKCEAEKMELHIQKEIDTYKSETAKRIDRLEDTISVRFNRIEDLIEVLRRHNDNIPNR